MRAICRRLLPVFILVLPPVVAGQAADQAATPVRAANGALVAKGSDNQDASEIIAAALRQAPSGGGVVDATSLVGNRNWNSTLVISRPGTRLVLGCGIYKGSASPMISIQSSNVYVEGCVTTGGNSQAGTTLMTTSGAGVFVGTGAQSRSYLEDIRLSNFSIQAGFSAFHPGSYLLELSNVTNFVVDSVGAYGNNGAANYGYLLVGAEQGEIHGDTILGDSRVNVEWQRFALTQSASGNGVDFHGMTLQDQAPNGINMQFAKGCCDDASISNNHFVSSKGAIHNLDFESASSYTGSGKYSVIGNHFEITTAIGPGCSDIYIANTVGVLLAYNAVGGCGNSPFASIVLTSGSSQNIVRANYGLGGVLSIASGAFQNIIEDNESYTRYGVVLHDEGTDTTVQHNVGTLNWQDRFVAAGYNPGGGGAPYEMEQFLPRSSTASPSTSLNNYNGIAIYTASGAAGPVRSFESWKTTDGTLLGVLGCYYNRGGAPSCGGWGAENGGATYWDWTPNSFQINVPLTVKNSTGSGSFVMSTGKGVTKTCTTLPTVVDGIITSC